MVGLQIYLISSAAAGGRFRLLKILLASILLYPIYLIRVPGLFVTVAFVVYLIIKTRDKASFISYLKAVSAIAIGAVIGFCLVKPVYNSFNFNNDPGIVELSPYHWLAMGANTE
jgi:hypothetical protein